MVRVGVLTLQTASHFGVFDEIGKLQHATLKRLKCGVGNLG